MNNTSAEQWGHAAVTWGESFFQMRVLQEDDKERLREAVKAEANRDTPRTDRIALLNKQLHKD